MSGSLEVSKSPTVEVPDWLEEILQLPGCHELAYPYWEGPAAAESVGKEGGSTVHGSDSLIRNMHTSTPTQPAYLRGVRVFLQPEEQRVHSVWPLGANVCSHPGMAHGAFSVLCMDETLGTMHYNLLRPSMGPGFTVNLQVDFCKPVPAGSTVYCMGEVESVEGRKAKLKGSLMDRPGGTLLLSASALFVSPKQQAAM
eukprot:CAMPEP_0196574572 /NCGR_PEP_ID=MMETSP1081-20130531/4276_1 /TAXON_ID=36882 /ORGANISM="Pyramimonas amylifera, Strain CCMP720" /LENGTH=197 /DNA_ID=CAMNT_0041892651 /DNA_START=26 /DNA_END=619 /DNA_ORIENTATION=+